MAAAAAAALDKHRTGTTETETHETDWETKALEETGKD